MEVPQNLLDATERKLAKLEAFLDESGWVDVGFVEEQNPRISDKFHCEIVAHVKGHRLKVEGSAGEAMGALDQAAQKVDKQVRRLKDKRVRRRRNNTESLGEFAADGDGQMADVVPMDTGGPATEPGQPGEPGDPVIVDVRQADAKPMSPQEAALQLDARGQDFLLFVNAENGRAAVIYRRRDGDYGLIEAPG